MIARLIGILIMLMAAAAPAAADVFKPAYLELRQTGPETYDVLWKVPALDEATTIGITPLFPAGTSALDAPQSVFSSGSAALRWKARVPGGLEGKTIRFDGLDRAGLDVLVRLERSDGSSQVEQVLPGESAIEFRSSLGTLEVAVTYLVIGIEHILMGVDHLLFVAGLVLLVRGHGRLFWTITAFTIAHSITLALATLGFVNVPGPPVEAAIALSIIFVALEIVRGQHGHPSLASDRPWLIGFSFGLLHGLGFAGALAEVGLPHKSIPMALLFFNVGVEVGQLFFVGTLLLAAAAVRRSIRNLDPRRSVVLPAYVIGGVASYWFIERLAAFVA